MQGPRDGRANGAGQTAVLIENLSVAFGEEGESRFVAVRDLTISVAEGEFICLLGPSGCGKSTVLNVLAGLLPPAAGRVQVHGRPVSGINPRVGYMFQKETLLPWASATENVLLPMEAVGKPDRAEARRLLHLVGLAGFEHFYPWQLSGGMRKRVQLARLLAQDPELLLMDEPFGALDAQTRLMIQEEFLRIWERDRKTVLFVTHDLSEAITLADRILLLTGRPGQLKAQYTVDLPRPRDVAGAMGQEQFHALFREMWDALKDAMHRPPAFDGAAERS